MSIFQSNKKNIKVYFNAYLVLFQSIFAYSSELEVPKPNK
jgi:hypothetical protein